MASAEAMYFKVPSDGEQSSTGKSFFKVSAALVGGACLVCLGIMAMYASSPALNSAAESTSLLGLNLKPASLRAPKSPMLASTLGNRLPGAGPWKDLTLATMEAANQCNRDFKVSALNGPKAAMARLSSKDRAEVQATAAAMTAKASDLLKAGNTLPLGFWDPAGFSTGISEGRLLFYREAELKHGRICMLAFLGTLVGENVHPLLGGVDVAGVTHFTKHAPTVGLELFWKAAALQNFAAITYLEVTKSLPTIDFPSNANVADVQRDYEAGGDAFAMATGTGRVPGDFEFDPLGLKPKTENDLLEMQNKEILNGRLAMIAVAGIVGQELVTGKHVFR